MQFFLIDSSNKFENGGFGNFYIISPENAIGESDELFNDLGPLTKHAITVVPANFETVFQYGSDFRPVNGSVGDPKCQQDGVAAQILVRGLPDNLVKNAFIPDNTYKPGTMKSIKNYVDAHLMGNHGWILEIDNILDGKIQKRND